jgi:hypothetical protein
MPRILSDHSEECIMNHWTRKIFRVSEAFVVLLFLGMGLSNMVSFLCGSGNTNNFHALGSLKIQMFSNNKILVTGLVINELTVPLRNISVIVDVYDENERILGTGNLSFGPEVVIDPGNSHAFDVPVLVPAGYRAVKKYMVIPHSSKGTGKLTNVLVSAL